MSQDASTLLLAHHLKALKLPTFLRDYAGVAATCSQERSSYPQYLLQLAERELIDRERRATERRIREAAFPVLKTIETFDFGAQPSINEPLVRELLRGEYMQKRENVLLVGNPGTGKTHLATALGFAACAQGKRVRPLAESVGSKLVLPCDVGSGDDLAAVVMAARLADVVRTLLLAAVRALDHRHRRQHDAVHDDVGGRG